MKTYNKELLKLRLKTWFDYYWWKFKDNLKFILFILITIGAVIFCIWAGIPWFNHRTPLIDSVYLEIDYRYYSNQIPNNLVIPSNDEINNIINELYHNPNYIIFKKDLKKEKLWGQADVYFRNIYIEQTLTGVSYTTTLSHELTHIIQFTRDERYVQFYSFKMLYESGNDYLKFCAIKELIRMTGGGMPKEYDASGQITNYLRDNGISSINWIDTV